VNLSVRPIVWTGTMIADVVISKQGARVRTLSIEAEFETAGRAWLRAVGEPELDRAYRLAGFLLGNAPEAEDATQDALARAWSQRQSLRNLESAQSWFDRILVNVCRDRLRRRRIVHWIPMPGLEARAGADPFAEALARDLVLRGLSTLDPDHRIVVVLRFWADLSLESIADRIGVPLGTVKSRLHYALRDLGRSIEQAGEHR
jgi:RNA polymerase sigma-70 factor (ECF subfamily)